jgi:DNA-binding transcriptional LysR family regulator
MSKFKQLEAFVSVIEQGGFAAAGKKLHLTSAAISKQIKALEETLGVELIQRTTRNFSLTEIGAHYFEEAKNILEQLNQADALILQTRQEPQGVLKVVSSYYFAEHYILPKLAEFLHRYPKIKLKLELAERLPDMVREDIDILFGVSVDAYPDFVRKTISHTRYAFCASKKYLKKYGTPEHPEDLKKHHYITHSMRDKPNFVSFRNHQDIYVQPYLWFNDSKAILEAALQGLGIMKLHYYFVEEALKNKKLIEIFKDYVEPKQAVYFYYRKSRYLDPKIRAFNEFTEA